MIMIILYTHVNNCSDVQYILYIMIIDIILYIRIMIIMSFSYRDIYVLPRYNHVYNVMYSSVE